MQLYHYNNILSILKKKKIVSLEENPADRLKAVPQFSGSQSQFQGLKRSGRNKVLWFFIQDYIKPEKLKRKKKLRKRKIINIFL